MREDMYKVIVERPRRSKSRSSPAARLRNDFDGPPRLATRAGYEYRDLNENLAPLRRYLRSQIGRPWNKVFGEICARIDRRNTVQQHIHQHIRGYIAIDVGINEGELVDLAKRWPSRSHVSGIYQELYVDPHSGLIRPNADYVRWRQKVKERCLRQQAEVAARRRVLDARTLLLLIEGLWFQVEVDALPEKHYIQKSADGRPYKHAVAEARYDVVLRKRVSRVMYDEMRQCEYLYGSDTVYAVGKRQISNREIKLHGLRDQNGRRHEAADRNTT